MATESTPLTQTVKLSVGSRPSFITSESEDIKITVGAASVSRFGAFVNLANVIVGSGIVGLSYVAKVAGVFPFAIFLCVSAGLAYQTLQFLVASTAYTEGQNSYEAVGRAALGQQGVVLTAVVICMQNFGGMTSYLILIAKSGPPVLKLLHLHDVEPSKLLIMATCFVVYPLCLMRDLKLLAPTCFFALCVFLWVMLTASYYYLVGDDWYGSDVAIASGIGQTTFHGSESVSLADVNWTSFSMEAFEQFPTIIFAFVCHTACLPIYSQLKDASKERMGNVNLGSISVAFMLYLVTGVAGYLTYAGHTRSTLIMNLRHCWGPVGEEECKDNSLVIGLLNVAFLAAILLGYPCVHFPTRRAIIALIWGVDKEFSWIVHCGVATCIVGTTMALALLCEDASKAFSWTGSIASPIIVFILPSFYYQHLLGSRDKVPVFSAKRLWPISVMCCGLGFMGICLYVKVQSFLRSLKS